MSMYKCACSEQLFSLTLAVFLIFYVQEAFIVVELLLQIEASKSNAGKQGARL